LGEARQRAVFVGDCPKVEVKVNGVPLIGLIDTGSQVTLMRQSIFDEHYPADALSHGATPNKLTLRAANGLSIPYQGYVVMDFEIGGANISGRGVVLCGEDCCNCQTWPTSYSHPEYDLLPCFYRPLPEAGEGVSC